MKKVLCVILALVLCMAVVFTGCGDTSDKGGSVEDDTALDAFLANDAVGDVRSDIEIKEGETTVETYVPEEVAVFINNSYYIEGTVYTSGSAMDINLATDGKNVQVSASVSGLAFGMLVLDDTTYMIQPAAKTYTVLSEALLSALGLEESFSVEDFQSLKVGEDGIYSLKQSKVTINGEAGLCNEYDYEDATIKLYSIGDELIQVDNYNDKGVLTMQIVVDSITGTIPSDQLTLKGLEEASITTFISSYFATAQ